MDCLLAWFTKRQEKWDLMVGCTQNVTAGTITYTFKYQNAKHYQSQLENNQNKITGGETNHFVRMPANGCVWIKKAIDMVPRVLHTCLQNKCFMELHRFENESNYITHLNRGFRLQTWVIICNKEDEKFIKMLNTLCKIKLKAKSHLITLLKDLCLVKRVLGIW